MFCSATVGLLVEPTGGFVTIDAFSAESAGLFGTACAVKFGCAFSDVVAAVEPTVIGIPSLDVIGVPLLSTNTPPSVTIAPDCSISTEDSDSLLCGIPPTVPIITGCCCSWSANRIITVVPGTGPVGVQPIPFIAAEITGCIGVAHGRSIVGSKLLS